MKVSETFYSIQGEGKLAGVPSTFIRASGCNLRCTWCDTDYASWNPEGRELSIDALLAIAESFPTRHVVVTGGEPMIMPDIVDLFARLRERLFHVTLETAATLFEPVMADLASLSPKLSNSTPSERESGRFAQAHDAQRLNIPVIQRFIDGSADMQLKFVVSAESDLAEITAILAQLRNWSPLDVLLMPEGVEPAALDARAPWLAELCKREGFRYCPRLHVQLWGNRRGV